MRKRHVGFAHALSLCMLTGCASYRSSIDVESSMKVMLARLESIAVTHPKVEARDIGTVFPGLEPPLETTNRARGMWVGPGFVLDDGTRVKHVDVDVLAGGSVLSIHLYLRPTPCFDQAKVDALYTGLLDSESNANALPNMESVFRVRRGSKWEAWFGTNALHRGCVTRIGFLFR